MSEERLWTEEERLLSNTFGLADWFAVAHAERKRAIEYALDVWKLERMDAEVDGDYTDGADPWSITGSNGDEAVSWLVSLGLLEKHPERDWYRLPPKTDNPR